ncbi:hypothetical protein ACVWZK_007046 [Bradyrhizobium sp. GM0.4]
MDLKHVGVKGQLVDADEFFEIQIDGEIEPAFVDRTFLQTAGRISEHLADIGGRKLHPVLLPGVRQQPERFLLDGALACIGIGRLVVVGFLVFLSRGLGSRDQASRNDQRPHRIPDCSGGHAHLPSDQ